MALLPRSMKLGVVIRLEVPPPQMTMQKLTEILNEELAALNALSMARSFDLITIDLDTPSRRLGELTQAFKQLQRPSHTRLSLTTLISHTQQPELLELAQHVGHLTLQVHSLERSKTNRLAPLVRPQEAYQAAQRISQLGIPFRIALPTYGYLVHLDPQGKILRVYAEQNWPPKEASHTELIIRAQPEILSEQVRQWQQAKLDGFEGLSWYRLPSSHTKLTWNWPTFIEVTRGRTPKYFLSLCIEPRDFGQEKGLGRYALYLKNDGNLDWDWRAPLSITILGGEIKTLVTRFHAPLQLIQGRIISTALKTRTPYLDTRQSLIEQVRVASPPQLIAELSIHALAPLQWQSALEGDARPERVSIEPCEAWLTP